MFLGSASNPAFSKRGGYDWSIKVYPSGFDEKFQDHISVYVRPQISDDTNVKALVSMAVVDPTRGSPMLPFRSFSHIYDGRKCEGWGWVDLITVASAKSDYVAHDGSFTLHCRVDVTVDSCTSNTIRDTTAAASPVPVPVPPSNMSWHLEKLLASEEGCDVEFMVEEKEIHAHGLVIATRSQALHELVESTTGTDHVNIDDMKASTFKAMLHFIDTDELPHINDLAAVPSGSSAAMVAREVLAAACRFRLDRMKRLCENLLAENITPGNALATLELAGRHGCDELEGYCIEYISLPHVVKDVMKTLKIFQASSKCENKHPATCNS